MRAKEYEVLRRAIDEGCLYGVRKYYKHRGLGVAEAGVQQLADAVAKEVSNAICEWFDLEENLGGQ